MTIKDSIEQLDWYFYNDNGLAAEDITKEAYEAIKTIAIQQKEN